MASMCPHGRPTTESCSDCESCDHDVVLNGACFYCGREDLELDIKKDNLIPVSDLTRPRK